MTRALLPLLLSAVATVPAFGGTARASESGDLLGLGVRARPAFDGADARRVDAVPVVSFERRFGLVRSTQGLTEAALLLRPLPSLKLGAMVALEEQIEFSEVDALARRGLDDTDRSVSIGPFIEFGASVGPVPFSVIARWRQDLDDDRGAQADLRLTVGLYGSARTRIGSFAQWTWADEDSMRFAYGVDNATAARTGLPRYVPSSGLRHVGLGVFGRQDVSQRWSVVAAFELRFLGEGPEDSPLTSERRALLGVVGTAYRF